MPKVRKGKKKKKKKAPKSSIIHKSSNKTLESEKNTNAGQKTRID